ncbi:MAG: extradiol ring-cleavage dioxygenase [Alphaproteobacteria bacterium]|nr:extradiol ring-cleavage dioxygenase [Alphaproteobacteria bacterium]
MAKVVMGIGSSHSPALLMKPDAWLARAEADDKRDMFALHDHTGRKLSYAELATQAPRSLLKELDPNILQTRHEANEAAIARITEVLDAADPDIVLLIGDDHKEVYQDDNMPALAVYWGETLPYRPKGMMKWKYDPKLMPDFWYWQDNRDYPVASGFARRLIGDLMARDFDPAHSKYYPEGQGMTHSFGYVYRRIMTNKTYPVIPVSVNTYYPPNQMHPGRCFRIGQALREAIESWTEDLRVVVMATGGLSHFVVDEAFDRDFLRIMDKGTAEDHAALPLEKLQSGNSELRCWSVLAGAVQGMDMNLIDYVPCYRSEAGTGCAMAFAYWE